MMARRAHNHADQEPGMGEAQGAAETPQEAAPPARPTFSSGRFTFAVQKVASVPEEVISKGGRKDELFFKDFFEGAEHNDHLFIPDDFWSAPREEGGRGVDPAKVTTAYVRQKIRDQFNTWKAKTAPPEGSTGPNPREDFQILLFPRSAGEAGPAGQEFTDKGISIFFVRKTR